MNSPRSAWGDALADGGAKAGVFLKQTQCGILDQLFGVGAFLAGDLSEMRFLLGCEVEFHRLQSTE